MPALVVPAAVALAACGNSSKSPTATTTAAATSVAGGASAKAGTTTGTTITKVRAGASAPVRQSSLRKCLRKQGITLPTPKPGQHGGPFGPGGPKLPSGMTQAQLGTALAKCAGQTAGGFRGHPLRLRPGAKQAFNSFAACMRQNGVDLPAPNLSGKGPVFSTKGVNAAGAKFRAAEIKCRRLLVSGFRGRSSGGATSARPRRRADQRRLGSGIAAGLGLAAIAGSGSAARVPLAGSSA